MRGWLIIAALLAMLVFACELAFPTHLSGSDCPSTCSGSTTLVSCKGTQSPCPLGCTPDPSLGARCLDLQPSGVATPASYTTATADVAWAADAGADVDGGGETIVIDTGSGAITSGTTVLRAAGTGLDSTSGITFTLVDQLDDSRVSTVSPGLGAFGFHSLSIGSNVTVVVKGARAGALLADTDVVIDGLVMLGCNGAVPGPGGFTSDQGPCTGHAGTTSQCGTNPHTGNPIYCYSPGGGAGFATAGGAGAGGTPGGPPFPPLNGGPFALYGGSGGGSGGGGGGALQIVANRTFTMEGAIDAPGCGGGGGGGGGAGGMVVIESPSVNIGSTAIVAANGGSGGTTGGMLGAQPASGAPQAGQGGALLGDPTSGTGGGGSGGGGGSAGRVLLNSLPGSLSIADGGIVSPAPHVGGVIGK